MLARSKQNAKLEGRTFVLFQWHARESEAHAQEHSVHNEKDTAMHKLLSKLLKQEMHIMATVFVQIL